MKQCYLLLLCVGAFLQLNAQDAYHNYLTSFLQEDYSVTGGEWLFFDSEAAIVQDAAAYGVSNSIQDAVDQVFAKKIRFVVNQAGGNPWNAGWNLRNNLLIQPNDILLAVFYLRSEGGKGEVNFFAEHATTYEKEIYLSLPIDEEWRRYFVPIKSQKTYSVNNMSWGFHLATQAQTVEMGGFTAINFKKEVGLENLPNEVNNQLYGGSEEDAPWRTVAAERIEQLRKANLTIATTTESGDAVSGVPIDVKMLRHDFDFGTAVTAHRLAGNNGHNLIYENKLIDLDGSGRGFNTVVFENDFKWDAWEEEWLVNKTELVNAVSWLESNNLRIRGHNLVWPGNEYLPDDINGNLNNLDYLKNRINSRIETALTFSGIEGKVDEWDVLNEVVVNTALADAFRGSEGYSTGRELYVDIFNKAREVDEDMGLWINDYVTMTLNQTAGSPQYDQLKQYVGELVDAGVDIEGVGFQAHIGGFPNDINEVLGTLDDFYDSFGLKAKITEFDLPTFVSEELGGAYLRDMMTVAYSHPSMDGFLFWNFWDGATWQSAGANMFREDWRATPARDVFMDLLYNEWWTEDILLTSNDGMAELRGFKGLYEIVYECNGELVREQVNLTEDFEFTVSCDNWITNTEEFSRRNIKIYPNPSKGSLQIELPSNVETEVRLFDMSGRKVLETKLTTMKTTLDIAELKGVYLLELISEESMFVEKLVVE